MKKYTVYGSCQAHALGLILDSNPHFRSQYQYHPIQIAHSLTLSEIENLNQTLFPQMDLFIYQPIINYEQPKTTEYITHHILSPNCQKIVFPFLNFNGYHPQTVMVWDDLNKTNISSYLPDCVYHDRNLIKAYLQPNFSLTQCLDQINNHYFYTPTELNQIVEESLDQLRRRETNNHLGYYIKCADLIANNFRKHLLFFTNNHPTKHVFHYIAIQIFNYLSIWSEYDDTIDPLFQWGVLPIYPSVFTQLNLAFDQPKKYIRNQIELCKYDAFVKIIDKYNQICQHQMGWDALANSVKLV